MKKRFSLLIQLVLYLFLLVLGLIGAVGALYYQTSSNSISQLTEQKTRDTIEQSSQFIAAYINKLKTTTTSLAENAQIKAFAGNSQDITSDTVVNLFKTVLSTDKDLVSATLVTKDGRTVSTDPNLTMQTSSDMMAENWYQLAIKNSSMPELTPARQNTAKNWVVSVTQEVTDGAGHNLGVLRLDIGYDTLAGYLDRLKLGKNGFSFIVNSQHQFVYHPKKSVYSSSQEMAAMKPYLGVTNGYTKKRAQFVYQRVIPDSHWTLIGVASLESLHQLQNQMMVSFVAIGLLATLLCALAIWLLLRRWIKPLRDLQQLILKIAGGEKGLRAKEQGAPELLDLACEFNRMLDTIDQLMLDVTQKEQKAREYELKALASQINPHFLYNTLDTIVWMAEFHDSRRVVDVTKSLATYFRLALNQGQEQIKLKDELEHVRQYLFIQQQRYGDKLNYEVAEAGAFADYQLPKLVLQPLVENAIYHGIKEVAHLGQIKVMVTEEKNHLVLSVYDNGKGMPSLASEKNGLRLGGVGLSNVDQRLRLQFGEAYHMEIESKENHFTNIKLFLPKEIK
ncbi:cache domain-containing sensor histidine kinase [Streptococcus massiliensis]|uniref:Histidine kinase n=1 Tax=Streptococcus massiliensis TaxID=313439 RepID=A0A380KWD0_9STRE|nr:sensor histidine kinase [Streptococcus massiliensis]SUN75861.1 histidine kinase [Streptococcus massiliensis]